MVTGEGSSLDGGSPTFFLPGTIDNATGTITFNADTIFGTGPGVNGNGTLGILTLTGLSTGISNIELANVANAASQKDFCGAAGSKILGPGEYQISSSAKGFQTAKTQFTLTAGENRDVSLVLPTGGDSTNVVVTSQAPLLDTGESREELTLNQAALA